MAGSYVPITSTFRPNPFLSFLENRDIVTRDGDSLTLVNPAYMTRQIYELGKDEYGSIGHLSSLKPINPFNEPNNSEKQALIGFENGDTLFVTDDTIKGSVFHMHVRPFVIEANCLKCHAHQGYKIGDIRGALFTAVPTEEFMQIKNKEIKSTIINFLFVCAVGVLVILLIMYSLNKQVKARKIADKTIIQRNNELTKINLDKDRFISILGHDLRNPFNNILGLSEILTDEIESLDKNQIQDITKNINKSAKITNKLLEDILLWSRSQQGKVQYKPQILSFADISMDAIEVLRPVAETKNIRIINNVKGEVNVFADIDMLRTVLRNLVSNAIKFTNKGGEIIINADQGESDVEISVSDNGIGIPPESLSKLFDISEILTTQGTESEKGTGLGLLMCKDFVEKHGGKIWVESEVGKGSEFKFTLPLPIP